MRKSSVRYLVLLAAVLLAAALPAVGHVGSPDIYFDGKAGPYALLVTVRPPAMIPGVAEIEIRSSSPGVRSIQAVPLYMVGEGSKYPPSPDPLKVSKEDPQSFAGSLWIMGSGSWQVRLEADGTEGRGTLAVPVPAYATRTLPMQKALGWFLFSVMLFLVAAFVSILGAGRREGFLNPGERAGPAQSRRALMVMGVAAMAMGAILYFGRGWWNSSAADLARRMIYTAPTLASTLQPGGQLAMTIGESEWHKNRQGTVATDLIPDHGHLMHLFLVRTPGMDRFYHLHPERGTDETFRQQLPAIPAGRYELFADIVRSSGFPDTMTTEIDLPDVAGKPLEGDDSEASAPALAGAPSVQDSAPLAGGGRMVWEREQKPLRAKQVAWFRFRVEDAAGKPAGDLVTYMGMAGHAEFLSADRSVFAHVHPEGSVAMAALTLAGMPMANMHMGHDMPVAPEIAFPYGLPKAGTYRLFVQVKRAKKVETATFDIQVAP